MSQKKTGFIAFIIVLLVILVAALFIWVDYRNFINKDKNEKFDTLEKAPMLYEKNEKGEESEVSKIGSMWIYKGERTGEPVTEIDDIDNTYKEENEKVYLLDEEVSVYTKENINFASRGITEFYSSTGLNDDMKKGSNSWGSNRGNEIHVFMNQIGKNTVIFEMDGEQGQLQGIIYARVISNFDIYNLKDLSIESDKDIDLAMSKAPYSRFLKRYSFENDVLKVYYDMPMEEYMQEDIALAFMTVFKDLKTVEINLDEATIKTMKTTSDEDKYINELNFTFTYDELNSNGLIDKIRDRIAR